MRMANADWTLALKNNQKEKQTIPLQEPFEVAYLHHVLVAGMPKVHPLEHLPVVVHCKMWRHIEDRKKLVKELIFGEPEV